jgi:hypothetical protein
MAVTNEARKGPSYTQEETEFGLTVIEKLKEDIFSLEYAFPNVDPGRRPFGPFVLVQLRRLPSVTQSGFHLPDETVLANEEFNTAAKVLALGPLAFKKRDTLELWPEGIWVQPGMYVDIPRHGGFRFRKIIPDTKPIEWVTFATLKDHEFVHEITENPVDVSAYL